MEAPVWKLNPHVLNRYFFCKKRSLIHNHHLLNPKQQPFFTRIPPSRNHSVSNPSRNCSLSLSLSVTPPILNPLTFFTSRCSSPRPSSNPNPPSDHFFTHSRNCHDRAWNGDPEIAGIDGKIDGGVGLFGGKEREIRVVLLGWLGAKPKHMRRYAEWYASRGIQAVNFLVDVKEMLAFDLGRRVGTRISGFADEVISWSLDQGENGRERCLIFHTFSNTGWLVCGAILDIMQSRKVLLDKIKGCVVDSGGADPCNPQIWAAGFAAAMLKKRNSSPQSTMEEIDKTESELTDSKQNVEKEPLQETILVSLLEKSFSVILKLPDVNKRLTKIVSTLNESEICCPELYLYSTADKVIPFEAVESRMRERRKMGRRVWSTNFVSSPHVDHYRTFPDIYSLQLHNFLLYCFDEVNHP